MTKPLDGIALHTYFRRLGLQPEAQELLKCVRSSPPSRTPTSRAGTMPGWYPSTKMQCIIKAESAKVEFAFLLEAEHSDDVLEFWDQPPPIPLEYHDKRNHLQRPMHTADYFVFRYGSAGWEECKPVEALIRLTTQQPSRYVLEEHRNFRCPPGEAFAAKYGLTYCVRSSDQINWAAQDNWLPLEDYYHDLDKLIVSETDLETLYQIVDESPGMTLADLRLAASSLSTDCINIAIAKHALYVDLAAHRLSEPEHVLIWRSPQIARTYQHRGSGADDLGIDAHPVEVVQGSTGNWDGRQWRIHLGQTEMTLIGEGCDPFPLTRSAFEALVQAGKSVGMQTEVRSSITACGQDRLSCARPVDLAQAVFRNRVINPDPYEDEEQVQIMAQAESIPARTKRDCKRWYRDAEVTSGSGLIGLLPGYVNCGGKRKIEPPVIDLMEEVLTPPYDTVICKPKRGAYGEYLKQSEERGFPAVSERPFYQQAQRHKTAYEQVLSRQGARAAYPFKDYHHESEQTINRQGSYAWSMAHLDHLEIDLELCDSKTGQPRGKCWLTLMILSHPRRIVAYYLTCDPPSYRCCMMVMRLCVKRYGRLPTAITVDGGSEFKSVYFEHLLALYKVRKHQRPAHEPRFGAPLERLFGTMETEFLYHLLGNTQALRHPRTMTKATAPRRHAVWTLPALAERVKLWADEEYDLIPHPALGISPRTAYEQSMQRDGQRDHKHSPYDETFKRATFPSTTKGRAKVMPGKGARMNYLDYWCDEMRDPSVENTGVALRYDPFDVSKGYAYIHGQWRPCVTSYTELAGCSERELHLLASELRKRHRLLHGRERVEITQKQLADFRRENVAQEVILRQQRNDRETKAALIVLEGRHQTPMLASARDEPISSTLAPASSPSSRSKINQIRHSISHGDKLVVLRRIR